jgi:hypothetical protein
MFTIWNLIAGLGGGLFKVIDKILDMTRDKQLINQGKAIAKAEMDRKETVQAKIELEVNQEQTQILLGDNNKSDLVEKMNKGKF